MATYIAVKHKIRKQTAETTNLAKLHCRITRSQIQKNERKFIKVLVANDNF